MAMESVEAADAKQVEDLDRDDFPSLDSFLYYRVWQRFLMREGQANLPDIPEDACADVYKHILMKAGVCVLSPDIDPDKKTARFDPAEPCAFRPKSQVWLSRTDPEDDAFRKALTIRSVRKGELRFSEDSAFLDDASTGFWRVDLAPDESQVRQQLYHIMVFAKNTSASFGG